MRFDDPVAAIGHTPTVRLRRIGPAPTFAKLELANQFAMKDRVARSILTRARADGRLRSGDPIIESSSGTMALGLALVGRALGHPVHIVTDPRIDTVTETKLRALGCEVHVVPAMTGAGWQSARLELLQRLLHDLPDAFWPQQYSNPDNPAAYESLAQELVSDLGRVDVLVGAVGSGGSLCGTAAALRERVAELTVVAVDCVGSMIFAQPDRPQRQQSGLGNSMQAPNVDYRQIDCVHWLSDAEAFGATRALAAEQQIFAGNSSGSVYQVLADVARRYPETATVVGIFPDRGDRYVDSVFAAGPRGGSGSAEDTGTDAGSTAESERPYLVAGSSRRPDEVRYGTPVRHWSTAALPRPRPPLLFVESNTTGTGMQALNIATRLGTQPMLLTTTPERYPAAEATRAQVLVCDTDSPTALLDQALALSIPPVGVLTTSEYSLVPAARLAGQLGRRGNPVESVQQCRNKAATRAALTAAGITQPAYRVIEGSADLRERTRVIAELSDAVGWPLVVKPVEDSGSNLVVQVDTVEAARQAVAEVLSVRHNVRGQPVPGLALVEQSVAGEEYSVEMFSVAGRHRCIGVTAKHLAAPPHFVEYRHIFPAPIPDTVADQLASYGRQVLDAVGWCWGATHLEIRLASTGPRLIEINARLAGGMIPELIRLAHGVDVLEQQLRCALDMPLVWQPMRAKTAGIQFLLATEQGVFDGLAGVEDALGIPGVDRVVCTATAGQRVRPARNAYDRLGYLIAVAERAEDVEAALDAAAGELRLRITADAPPAPRAAPEPAGAGGSRA